MKRWLIPFLLLFLIAPVQASQEVPEDQLLNVSAKVESRVTIHPSGDYYFWIRVKAVGAVTKKYCLLFSTPRDGAISDFNKFGMGYVLNMRMVTYGSFMLGTWGNFWTNADGIEQDPGSMKWCKE